jgi:hypothetical protein
VYNMKLCRLKVGSEVYNVKLYRLKVGSEVKCRAAQQCVSREEEM